MKPRTPRAVPDPVPCDTERRSHPRCSQGSGPPHTRHSTIPARRHRAPLGRHRARPARPTRSRAPPRQPLDASGQLSHLTLSKTSTRPGDDDRLAHGSPMGLAASRLGSRFGRTRVERGGCCSHPSARSTRRPLTPVSPASTPGMPVLPASRCRLCRRHVNDDGFRDTERLPPACGPPRAVRSAPALPPEPTS